jgi:hypothetical protein
MKKYGRRRKFAPERHTVEKARNRLIKDGEDRKK